MMGSQVHILTHQGEHDLDQVEDLPLVAHNDVAELAIDLGGREHAFQDDRGNSGTVMTGLSSGFFYPQESCLSPLAGSLTTQLVEEPTGPAAVAVANHGRTFLSAL